MEFHFIKVLVGLKKNASNPCFYKSILLRACWGFNPKQQTFDFYYNVTFFVSDS